MQLSDKQQLFGYLGSIFHDSRKILDAEFKKLGLSRPEWLVLAMLRHYPDTLTQSYALHYTGVEKSYFTKVLNSIEEKGYIIREIDPANRRNRIIKANPKSKKIIQQAFDIIETLVDNIQRSLDDSELKTLHKLLAKIQGDLDNYPSSK